MDRQYHSDAGDLQQQSHELGERLEIAWTYVGPGCPHANDERYLARFLELLAEYEQVEDRLQTNRGQPSQPGQAEQVWLGAG